MSQYPSWVLGFLVWLIGLVVMFVLFCQSKFKDFTFGEKTMMSLFFSVIWPIFLLVAGVGELIEWITRVLDDIHDIWMEKRYAQFVRNRSR